LAASTTNITHAAPASAMKPGSAAVSSEDPAAQPPGASDAQQASAPMSMGDRVEQRIKTLHDKLKITAAQESEWGDVAQAMRDNETSMSQLIEERRANAKTMSAVEDLQSYQKIAQAHADGLAKLIPAFETLYTDLSDTQKKNADEVFGRFEGHRGMSKASGKPMHKKATAPATQQ